jgi:hypothetical protein
MHWATVWLLAGAVPPIACVAITANTQYLKTTSVTADICILAVQQNVTEMVRVPFVLRC